MQSLNHEQMDAILDLVEQCYVVTAYHAQSEAARCDREAQKKGADGETLAAFTDRTYQQSIKDLTQFYVEGNCLGIEQLVLDGVLRRNLPQPVVDSLQLDTVA